MALQPSARGARCVVVALSLVHAAALLPSFSPSQRLQPSRGRIAQARRRATTTAAHRGAWTMSDGAGQRQRKVKKGGVLTKDKKKKKDEAATGVQEKQKELLKFEKEWRLVLHNDDWHTFG